jgi:DNA-binding GntR family transcriptional regulator
MGMLMDEGLIRAQAMAVRTACAWLPAHRVSDLHERVDRASSSWASSPWEHRAVAHAHNFVLLADASGDPVVSPVLRGAADMMRELLLAVGPGANGMIVSSRRRLLERLRAGDPEGAALEIEQNLNTLCFMWRLARSGRTNAA